MTRDRARASVRVCLSRSPAFYLRAFIDGALAAGNNAKSPDTSHPQNWSLGGRNFRSASTPNPVPYPHALTCVRARACTCMVALGWSELESSTGAERRGAARRGTPSDGRCIMRSGQARISRLVPIKAARADFRRVDLRRGVRDSRRANFASASIIGA